jgi:hypothetical protein
MPGKIERFSVQVRILAEVQVPHEAEMVQKIDIHVEHLQKEKRYKEERAPGKREQKTQHQHHCAFIQVSGKNVL